MPSPPWHEPLTRISRLLGPELAAELDATAAALPPVARLEQQLPRPRVGDAAAAVAAELARPEVEATLAQLVPAAGSGAGFPARAGSGPRVAVAVGSRGIGQLAEIVAALVAGLKARGLAPFLVPAMGSHGGATPEGQARVLAGYGVTEAAVGAPVVAGMETRLLGRLPDGAPVHFSEAALAADAIVPVVRVKPHTAFRGEIESGLLKMLAVGLGKQQGAEALHARGIETFPELLPAAAALILREAPVAFGLASVENAFGEPARLAAVPAAAFEATEKTLLREARELMGALPFAAVDVLVVGRIGKEISGAGMDPHVTGRYARGAPAGARPRCAVQRLVALGVTPASHGNAFGLGVADVIPLRLLEQLDLPALYANAFTSGGPEAARLPVALENDRLALAAAARLCARVEPEALRLCLIRSTKELGECWVSPALAEEAAALPDVALAEPPRPLAFAADGGLTWPPVGVSG